MSQLQQPDFEQAALLACQGDPSAIAQLMNRHLSAMGIVARVDRQGNTLTIFLESAQVPDQQQMMEFVRGGIANLQPEAIHFVKVYGGKLHHNSPIWGQEIPLDSSSTPYSSQTSLSEWLTQGTPNGGAQALTVRESTMLLAAADAPQPSPLSRPAFDESTEFRLLRFYVSSQDTASLPLNDIEEVVKLPIKEILPVPDLPDRVLGIYNWRSEMLWLVDLGQQLGFPSPITHPHVLETIWAIVIRVEGKLLGLGVPRLMGLETHPNRQLQLPTEELFGQPLRSFLKGYLTRSRHLVLEAKALMHDPLLQAHCR